MNQNGTIKELSIIFKDMCSDDVDKAKKNIDKIINIYGLPGNIKSIMEKVKTKL